MDVDAASGTGRSLDGVEGSDEDRLDRIDIGGEEGWYVFRYKQRKRIGSLAQKSLREAVFAQCRLGFLRMLGLRRKA